jgi:protein-tyrosine phosphatase
MVVAAYLMRREKWPRDRAIEYLRSRRPGVRPNPAFLELLGEWEEQLKKADRDGPSRSSLPGAKAA